MNPVVEDLDHENVECLALMRFVNVDSSEQDSGHGFQGILCRRNCCMRR